MTFHQTTLSFDTLTLAVGHEPTAMANVVDQEPALVTRRPCLTLDDPHDLQYAPAVTATVEGQTAHLDGTGA